MRLFDTFTWEEIAELEMRSSTDKVFSNYTFSSDSQWLFISYCDSIQEEYGYMCNENSYTLKVWNVAEIATNTQPVIQVEGLSQNLEAIMSVIPYPDGSFLIASWGWDSFDETGNEFLPMAVFWELEADGSYRELNRLEMRYVSFAPDGSYFLTGKDGQIELWGVPGGVASGN